MCQITTLQSARSSARQAALLAHFANVGCALERKQLNTAAEASQKWKEDESLHRQQQVLAARQALEAQLGEAVPVEPGPWTCAAPHDCDHKVLRPEALQAAYPPLTAPDSVLSWSKPSVSVRWLSLL